MAGIRPTRTEFLELKTFPFQSFRIEVPSCAIEVHIVK